MTRPFFRVVFSCLFNRRLPAARSDGARLAIRSDSRCVYHPFADSCYRFRRAFHGRLRNVTARDEPHDRRTQFEPRAVIAIRHVRNRDAEIECASVRQEELALFADVVAKNPAFAGPIRRSFTVTHGLM